MFTHLVNYKKGGTSISVHQQLTWSHKKQKVDKRTVYSQSLFVKTGQL